MIPSVLAQHVRQGVEDFLRTTFPVSTPFFNGLIENLFTEDGGIFKGPYLSIQLPFRQGKEGSDFFPKIPLNFTPFLHQEKAFERLSGMKPRSTIVATGTGSGKTECFLYPILEHCYRHRGEEGIKAVIIYPMNALATDQAGRIAKIIWNNENLRGHVTAGLYVGQSEREPSTRRVMSPDSIITNKDTMRLKPPDILLTNYKMLDYLLVRAKDFPLWKQNGETLRFLVVDELHTFDGAQGTDLACLLRRLKARLNTPQGFICCVGTSATLGGEAEQDSLLDYAGKIFGESFEESAIINELRLSAGEFLERSLISRIDIVPEDEKGKLDPESYDGYREYVRAQHKLWLGAEIPEEDFEKDEWRVDLCEKLRSHLFFQNLLKVLGGGTRGYDDILGELEKVTPEFQNAESSYKTNLLNSMLALISEARLWKDENENSTEPFLHVRLQYWLRELRRMVGEVSQNPRLRFADDLNEEQLQVHLPVVHCRECGSVGWTGLKRQHDSAVLTDLQSFYIGFFSDDPKVLFLFPEEGDIHKLGLDGDSYYFCTSCLHLTSQAKPENCPDCNHKDIIRVFAPNTRVRRKNRMIALHNCPFCGGVNSLTLIGSRAASLTSVAISQLFSSSFNDDKKLLTFSDSVQDAAHRAGFFAGRTYRFNFRSALQKFVFDEGKGQTLAELPGAFICYWSDRMDKNTYVATFLAPNMAWFRDYSYLEKNGRLPEGSTLRTYVDKRIEWEIYSEYGFSARIGRTLEKTGSSVAHVDTKLLDEITDLLLEMLRNEIGEMRGLDEMTLRRFLAGFCVHLKNHGAILHPVLKGYIESWGNTYRITQRHIKWMPNFGPSTRAPVFLTTKSDTRFDQLLSRSANRKTWYQSWADKCFTQINPLISAVTDRLYELVLKTLVDKELFEERQVRNDRVWGIKPEALRVSDQVIQFQCRRCSHNVSVSVSERDSWDGAPCLRFHCSGIYEEQEARADYYGKLYATGDVERVFAREHTGLLTREDREDLETRFKSGDGENRNPCNPNLLSCTPTLELGIDIGDLSSLILCSVPPAQANYLQRIGRAGRRDGNALNVTVANARPHDLYFFAEPEEMIAGRIDTPDVFLNASAVLERQLTAFCFDRWVESGITEAALPAKIGQVLSKLQPVDYRRFPHNFLRFIENSQTNLFDSFVEIFSETLTGESVEHLKVFVEGDSAWEDSLRYKIMTGLYTLHSERESLRKKIRTLNSKIRKKEKDPARDRKYEEDLGDLRREKGALQSLVSGINSRDTLNFFTDEGLIPNYAFPEAGVMLRSVIYRKKEQAQEGGRNYDVWTYEYERPAVSAIDELAPDSHFYAGGRKVKVDQVDMELSEVQTWRFCNDCSHMELLGKEEENPVCPRCGSALWSDEGQLRRMLRMRQVFATTSDRESRIEDDNDDRIPSFYNKQMMLDFEEQHITDAYKVDSEELPFGFEFLSKASFREINFGEKGEAGENVVIAGVELPRKGFVVCRQCGKVQDDKGKIGHAFTCTARDQESDKNLTDCVYLYREFSSEAIRMLLPVTTFAGSERKLHSFVAALQLGLKKKFGNNIYHLQTTVYEEPVPESTYRKKYLVLYDTIPGGTGYLKQLMRSEQPLLEVFDLALESLRTCTCNQDPGKDGCYRCLYAYRSSYHMAETSRDAAIELLSEILKHRDNLVKTETLRNVHVNALFDSELEVRFIEALRRTRMDDLPVTLSKELVNGKPGYFLKIGERAWYIEPQVNLGHGDNVSIASRADFIFYPARSQESVKPIVVFTDGFFFHKDRIGKDMAQRMAISHSNRYNVWSLTWKDVENRYRALSDYFRNYADPKGKPNDKNFDKFLKGFGIEKFRDIHRTDSFEWLVRYLSNPDEKAWQLYAFIHGLINLDPQGFSDPDVLKKWTAKLKKTLPEEMFELFKDVEDPCLYGLFEPEEQDNDAPLSLFVLADQEDVRQSNANEMKLACCLYDQVENRDRKYFENVWNGYLRLYNLFQFIPYAFFVTQEGLKGHAYDGIKIGEAPVVSDKETASDSWADICAVTGKELHTLLDTLAENGWPIPEVGYELVDNVGEIVATAELAWENKKIAFLQENELEYADAFEKAGWQVFSLTAVVDDPEAYIGLNKA
ncbi:MAG: DEAD/DEAH box helicase [Syntrophales bacterium]|nr:DEAD/DEAH box helicase [Syntrophales bacterium]